MSEKRIRFSKESEREIFGVAQGPVLRYAARDGVEIYEVNFIKILVGLSTKL